MNASALKKGSRNFSQLETQKKTDESKQGVEEESEVEREGEESEDEKGNSEPTSTRVANNEIDELAFDESTISNIQLSGQKDSTLKAKSIKQLTKTPRASQNTRNAEPSSLLYVEGGSDYHRMFSNPPKCLKVKRKKKKKSSTRRK